MEIQYVSTNLSSRLHGTTSQGSLTIKFSAIRTSHPTHEKQLIYRVTFNIIKTNGVLRCSTESYDPKTIRQQVTQQVTVSEQ